MQYLKLKKSSKTTESMAPVMRHKTSKFGDILEETALSKQKNLLICGPHDSGKTRTLTRLHEHAENIWRNQLKPYSKKTAVKRNPNRPIGSDGWKFPAPVYLAAVDPLSKWADHEAVADWWNEKYPEQKLYTKLPAYKRVDAISEYLEDTRAVLFIDDAHKLTERKLQVTKRCLLACGRAVVTASEETRIAPTLRLPLMASDPQIYRLESDASFDITGNAVWFLVVMLALAGQYEFAIVLGALKATQGGLRSAKE